MKPRLRWQQGAWVQTEPRRRISMNALYEAGGYGRRTKGWYAPSVGPNAALYGAQTVRDRARAARRNDAWAKSGIHGLVSEIVGTGIKPQSQCSKPKFRKAVEALWLRWTDESDADGVLDFYGQQALAAQTWLESGEAFVRLRTRRPTDGLSVPLQLQILEPEFCPDMYNSPSSTADVRAGVEFGPIGQRLAYWMYRFHPGSLIWLDVGSLHRVDASEIAHLYMPERPGQIRGAPHLAQVLLRLQNLDKFDDATLMRQQLSNLFTGFITRPESDEDAGVAIDPITGQSYTVDAQNMPQIGLEPGLMMEVDTPGAKIEWSQPPDAGPNYPPYIKQQLMAIAAGMELPYETLTGDLSSVNDRTVRVILSKFRRRVQQWQHHIVVQQLCRRVWLAWLDQAVLSGAIKAPGYADPEKRRDYQAVKWIPQGWAYINPVQDVQAQREAVRAGFKSRSEVVSENGYDSEAIDAEIAADNARADELGLVYDSDARWTDRAGRSLPPSIVDEQAQDKNPAATQTESKTGGK